MRLVLIVRGHELAGGNRTQACAVEVDLTASAALIIEVEKQIADRAFFHRGDQRCDTRLILHGDRNQFSDLEMASRNEAACRGLA